MPRYHIWGQHVLNSINVRPISIIGIQITEIKYTKRTALDKYFLVANYCVKAVFLKFDSTLRPPGESEKYG
jgi:hypothetical protein